MDATDFSAEAYWDKRHSDFSGDHRNVGDAGLTSEQNHDLITAKAVIVSHVLGRFGVARGAPVLDAGCGAGVLTKMLGHAGFEMWGTDMSAVAISNAQQHSAGTYAVCPVSAIQFDQKFAAVLCLDVLFHVVDDLEWRRSLDALLAAIQPNGIVIIIEYFPAPGTKSASHCRWRSAEDYREALQSLGAEIIDSFEFTYPHRPQRKTLMTIKRGGEPIGQGGSR